MVKSGREPDRIHIDKKDRELYEVLKSEEIFKDRENKDLFVISMAYGFKNRIKEGIEKKEGFVRVEYLSGWDLALINAVAMYDTNSVEVISNKEEVFKIAEEYAHAGVKLLFDKINSVQFGTFDKQFEKELHETYEELVAQDDKK